jgi:hypothetical protein
MAIRIWTYDVAREQSPSLDTLRQAALLTREAGYTGLGLYLEHRYAYASAPWTHGVGCVTPDMVRALQSEFPSLQIVPFINLLGHFEGFLYTEEGKRYREELFSGLQACPANPEFVELCERIVDETIDVFRSGLIHIGGDETWQLGASERSKARMAALEADWPSNGGGYDGKAALYAAHFGPLARRVLERGRRPAVWGDMFHDHPAALDAMPKETLIFDWQYFQGVADTATSFTGRGFEAVGCPALHTYNATWMHLPQSERNVRDVARDAGALGLAGVCVTTWECGLFGVYDTLWPALRASGAILRDPDGAPGFLDAYAAESPAHREWARLMGEELQEAGGLFAFGGTRSALKCRLLLYSNPFLLWMRHAEELCGEAGDRALATIEAAQRVAPGEAEKGVCQFARSAIEFARLAEEARLHYAKGETEACVTKLAVTRQLFDDLALVARRTHARVGGSLADVERCRTAKERVEAAIRAIRQYGDGSLGYLPAFEIVTHPKFVPHDQASWWLINRWANE